MKYFGRVSIWNFSLKWVFTFITLFYPQQEGPNPGKQHFSVKKAPEIRFCAAISHPIVVISTFWMVFEDIKVYLECFGGDLVK